MEEKKEDYMNCYASKSKVLHELPRLRAAGDLPLLKTSRAPPTNAAYFDILTCKCRVNNNCKKNKKYFFK